MKGHGLASFNLAVFFLKGLGGLPVDLKLAKELLAQAAEKGVPEVLSLFKCIFPSLLDYNLMFTIYILFFFLT